MFAIFFKFILQLRTAELMGRKYWKKNVGVGRFFSMHAKVNELVLIETKEETMLKIAQKFVKKGKKKKP